MVQGALEGQGVFCESFVEAADLDGCSLRGDVILLLGLGFLGEVY
jgi:hypothetical protein